MLNFCQKRQYFGAKRLDHFEYYKKVQSKHSHQKATKKWPSSNQNNMNKHFLFNFKPLKPMLNLTFITSVINNSFVELCLCTLIES